MDNLEAKLRCGRPCAVVIQFPAQKALRAVNVVVIVRKLPHGQITCIRRPVGFEAHKHRCGQQRQNRRGPRRNAPRFPWHSPQFTAVLPFERLLGLLGLPAGIEADNAVDRDRETEPIPQGTPCSHPRSGKRQRLPVFIRHAQAHEPFAGRRAEQMQKQRLKHEHHRHTEYAQPDRSQSRLGVRACDLQHQIPGQRAQQKIKAACDVPPHRRMDIRLHVLPQRGLGRGKEFSEIARRVERGKFRVRLPKSRGDTSGSIQVLLLGTQFLQLCIERALQRERSRRK